MNRTISTNQYDLTYLIREVLQELKGSIPTQCQSESFLTGDALIKHTIKQAVNAEIKLDNSFTTLYDIAL